MEEKKIEGQRGTETFLRYVFIFGFVMYCICLAVVASDELFNLGFFSTTGEKQISKLIQELGSPDSNVSQNAYNELTTNWSYVAVPQLIKSLKSKNESIKEKSLQCLKEITGVDFGFDIEKWNDWWKKSKDTH